MAGIVASETYAFPLYDEGERDAYMGVSTMAYIATRAMQAMLVKCGYSAIADNEKLQRGISEASFAMADAMLDVEIGE